MEVKEFLNTKQISEMLNVTEGTIAVWRSSNRHDIPYIKLGKKILYDPERIQEWLKSKSVN